MHTNLVQTIHHREKAPMAFSVLTHINTLLHAEPPPPALPSLTTDEEMAKKTFIVQ